MGSRNINIALCGQSGSGKSLVAQRLCSNYGYQLISTGNICRGISNLLFGDEAKGNLNKISTKLREIDEGIWIKAALRNVNKDLPIVFDSIRYFSDYIFFETEGYKIIRVVGNPALDAQRLKDRGQQIRGEDLNHPSEREVDNFKLHYTIRNVGVDVSRIDSQIAVLLGL